MNNRRFLKSEREVIKDFLKLRQVTGIEIETTHTSGRQNKLLRVSLSGDRSRLIYLSDRPKRPRDPKALLSLLKRHPVQELNQQQGA
jgi:hypothetical protein